MIDKIIGVIDLVDSLAVHAVAGHRDDYRPIVSVKDSSPLAMVDHYRRLGVPQFYVADLDSIVRGKIQTECLIEIANHASADAFLIDIGWKGECVQQADAVERLVRETDASTHFIIATESARRIAALSELVSRVGASRVHLSLDFRSGNWVGTVASESEWIDAAIEQKVAGIIVLDVAQVGTAGGPITQPRCRAIKRMCPDQRVLSGGGVRSIADVASLVDSGCEGVLVGTMLHP